MGLDEKSKLLPSRPKRCLYRGTHGLSEKSNLLSNEESAKDESDVSREREERRFGRALGGNEIDADIADRKKGAGKKKGGGRKEKTNRRGRF